MGGGTRLHFLWVSGILLLLGGGGTPTSFALHRSHPKSQGEAMDMLYFDPATLQRMAGSTPPEDASSLLFPELMISSDKIPQPGSKAADKISRLPGQPAGALDFNQYGGYITVGDRTGKALFYYFTEAPRHRSSSAPLLVWLNGGPGCSSLGYGAMQELGPFRVGSDGKTLFNNPYAWNRVANVLFLESPVGVGFSYSNTTTDLDKNGDKSTAKDSYTFLVNWLERFPEYKGRDLYVSGESYAGHYVSQLAHKILRHRNPDLSLKGIMIGNAVINEVTDNRGMYEFMWTHAVISDETFGLINGSCTFKKSDQPMNKTEASTRCRKGLDEINIGNINFYNIYEPLCLTETVSETLTRKPKRFSILHPDPCSDIYTYAYLNLPEVQRALHANVTHMEYEWSPCSYKIRFWQDASDTSLPLLKEFIKNSVRILVYSGDFDGRVPLTSTRASLREMKLPIITPWAPWNVHREVGGYSFVYEGNLTFATVRGAGHEVPLYQSERSLVMVKYFLQGKPLPTS